jgi:Major Facilitator Superfamily.
MGFFFLFWVLWTLCCRFWSYTFQRNLLLWQWEACHCFWEPGRRWEFHWQRIRQWFLLVCFWFTVSVSCLIIRREIPLILQYLQRNGQDILPWGIFFFMGR